MNPLTIIINRYISIYNSFLSHNCMEDCKGRLETMQYIGVGLDFYQHNFM